MLGLMKGVYLCVWLCQLYTAALKVWSIFIKLNTNCLENMNSNVFLRFLRPQFDDVIAAVLHFSKAALSRPWFWFLQILSRCRIPSSRIGIENKQNWSVTSVFCRKTQNCPTQACEVSFSANSGLFKTNVMIFCSD